MDEVGRVGAAALYPRSAYVRALRDELPANAFEPVRSRVVLVPIYFAILVASIAIAGMGWLPLWALPIVSLVIGSAFAFLTFVTHELMHGGIVRGRRLQLVLGWIGFAPFLLSPRLWIAWHNRAHHSHANLPDDPDAYATIEGYGARRSTRFAVDTFSLGGRRLRGALSLVLGFTVQSAHQLFTARSSGYLTRRQHVLAYAESALAVALWAVVAALVGFVPFLFVYVLPLLVANAWVMAFILTNHSLSPRVPVNDPLASGLSVTTSRLVSWVTLGFGLHVEHHLFPGMSSRHAPAVRALVQARWPERYQSMPLWRAVRELHRTARVYRDATTLLDPKTGSTYPTLLPRTGDTTVAG